MAIDLNRFGDCEEDFLGSGTDICDIQSFGDPRGIGLAKKTWRLNLTSGTFDAAAYRGFLQNLDIFPFTPIHDFQQGTPENTKNTSSVEIMRVTREGKPFFTFNFTKGSTSHKSLYQKRGQDRWDLLIFFDTGVLLAETSDGTEIKGFDAGMLSVETFKFVQGGDPEMSMALIQLVDTEEFNARHTFIPYTQIGLNLFRTDGVIDATLTTQPVSAGTTVEIDVRVSGNQDVVVRGLTDNNNWILGGTQATATTISSVAFNATTERYEITVNPALVGTDTVQPRLADVSNSYNVAITADNSLYKGTSALVTVS